MAYSSENDPGKPHVDSDLLLGKLARSPDLAPFRKLVEPLMAHDRERRSDLVRTLRIYFAAGANASEAADRLFLHRNSMLYRLARIEKLTGLDLKDSRAKLALQLGLLFIDELERSSGDAAQHP
jgi:DNA-binding PucR family transcriptional regulator